MLSALLAQFEHSNPRECALLGELESLEHRLDDLLLSQNSSLVLNTVGGPPRLRLHIYNTYAEQEEHDSHHVFIHTPPSSFTLYVRAFEVDASGSVLSSAEPGVLSRYFRQILLCTPDRTVLWDRDGIRDFHRCVRTQATDCKPPTSAPTMLVEMPPASCFTEDDQLPRTRVGHCDAEDLRSDAVPTCYDAVSDVCGDYGRLFESSPYKRPDDVQGIGGGGDCWNRRAPHQASNLPFSGSRVVDGGGGGGGGGRGGGGDGGGGGMDGRCGDPGPFNGYDELQVSQMCSTECQVTIYLFPANYTQMCTISAFLEEFLVTANGGAAVTDCAKQMSFYRVMSLVWMYAFENQLLYEDENGTFVRMDSVLSLLLGCAAGSPLAVRDIPRSLLPHILPAKPIKVTHDVKLTGDVSQGDRFLDLHLDSAVDLDGHVLVSDYDTEIDRVVHDLRDIVHVRNVYELYARDPCHFIDFMLDKCSVDNAKPLTVEMMNNSDMAGEAWLPRAIDNYMTWYDCPVFQLLYGSLNNLSKTDGPPGVEDWRDLDRTMRFAAGDPRDKGAQCLKRPDDQHPKAAVRAPDPRMKSRKEARGVPAASGVCVPRPGKHRVDPPVSAGHGKTNAKVSAGVSGHTVGGKYVDDVRFTDMYTAQDKMYPPGGDEHMGMCGVNLHGGAPVGGVVSGGKCMAPVPGVPAVEHLDSQLNRCYPGVDPGAQEGAMLVPDGGVMMANGPPVMDDPAIFAQQPNAAPGMVMADYVVHDGVYRAQVPHPAALDDHLVQGNGKLSSCYSGETQFDMSEHYVMEGSKTIEGDPRAASGGVMVVNGDPSGYHVQPVVPDGVGQVVSVDGNGVLYAPGQLDEGVSSVYDAANGGMPNGSVQLVEPGADVNGGPIPHHPQ